MSFRFTGFGSRNKSESWRSVKRLELSVMQEGKNYHIFDSNLLQAMNTAIALGMPMLVTGEPGVGKTTLANRIAYELDCELLTYRVKSNSEGSDLLYSIDNMHRLVDTYIEENRERVTDVRNYLKFNALGLAIMRAQSITRIKTLNLRENVWGKVISPEAVSSVVLIDEIDKAPADFPNDLLEELKDLNFKVPGLSGDDGRPLELGFDRSTDVQRKPFVLITSNAVRALPEAFLRRCVYYHMALPVRPSDEYNTFTRTMQERVSQILKDNDHVHDYKPYIEAAWKTFWQLREISPPLSRLPSTGEGLSWMLIAGQKLAGEPDTDAWRARSRCWSKMMMMWTLRAGHCWNRPPTRQIRPRAVFGGAIRRYR